ncbi:MAG: MFS transporter [Ignavibacteria bacterium]|jgi:MFS family permease|nr:MFS transporter [Ignavibacteria bacterium]MCU7502159.1 MFS transporter [Ignavibacteria bacterium]MCU7515561.1 MFS transporter [Ignavibacteria bacterium]
MAIKFSFRDIGILDSARNIFRDTFSSLKVRNYRLYYIGQGISLPGTWMQRVAQAWLVLKLTGSGTSLGLVTALQFLPVLLFTPLGGVIADRYPKRNLLYITQASQALSALLLATVVATNTVQLWMIYILAAFFGLINSVDNPTRQTFVFEMVGRKDLSNAVTLNSIEVNLARVVGPAIAGIIIAGAGLALCFFLNAASFIAVLICLFKMRKEELYTAERVKKIKGQLMKGFHYVRNEPLLRLVLILMGIIGTLAYEFDVSLPLLAKYTFHGDADSYALLTSAMGVGAVLGGLATAGKRKTSPYSIVITLFLFGSSILLTAVSPGLHFAAITMVFVGVFSIRFMTLGNTTLQLESAPEMRSRVMSLWTIAFLGSTPIGGPIIGWVAEYTNPRWGLAVGGIAALLAGLIGLAGVKGYLSKKYSGGLSQASAESGK